VRTRLWVTTTAWLLIAMPGLAGAETSIAGTWQAQSTPPGATWTAVLRVDGSKLTGAVSSCSSWEPHEIYETLIEGDTVTFKCKSGRSIVTFIGTVSGDHLDLAWDRQVPPYGNGLVGDIREDDSVEEKTAKMLFGPSAPRRLAAVRGPDAEDDLAQIAAKAAWTPAKPAPVPFERILHAEREPQNWLTYSGTLFGQRHSPLAQITPENVQKLELAWVWQARSQEKFEATPLVVDGVLYTVEAPSTVIAMDASTGQLLWTYAHTPPLNIVVCCGGVNRGLAIFDHTLFLGTLDAHLLAIDARTGRLLWDTVVANAFDPSCGGFICYSITLAPLIVKDKVIVGTAGGDPPLGFGIRAFVAALDANTGKEVWRFSTIPAPGEPGHDTWSGDSWKTGGAAIWNTGTYDPDLNLTYWGTGNPSPDFDGATRLGDNLYSSSVVALDADTGKLKWHYQFTPHDEMDWDAAQVPLLTNMEWQGEERKVMLFANRNGLMYTLDRKTGHLLTAKPFVEVNWMSGIDDQGRPIRIPRKEGTPVLPSSANNWYPPSYSPHTGLFYIPVSRAYNDPSQDGLVLALNPKTGEKKWEFTLPELPKRPIGSPCPCSTGVLTTASDLLFTGGQGRYFYALDARTGQLIWKASTGGPVQTGAISYSVNGKQYIAVPAGNTLFAFSLP